MLKEECKKYITDKFIVLRERQSKITFVNKKMDRIIKIDIKNCQLKNEEGKKCDYLLLKNNRETFVELKGKDIKKALEQLGVSIEKVSENPKKSDKSAIVVHSKNPYSATKIKEYKRIFKLKFNASLTVTKSNKQYELK